MDSSGYNLTVTLCKSSLADQSQEYQKYWLCFLFQRQRIADTGQCSPYWQTAIKRICLHLRILEVSAHVRPAWELRCFCHLMARPDLRNRHTVARGPIDGSNGGTDNSLNEATLTGLLKMTGQCFQDILFTVRGEGLAR